MQSVHDRELIPPARRQYLFWFQEDVRMMLNTMAFLELNAQERGLLLSMRLWYWWHGWLPVDPQRLARILQLPKSEVAKALPAVLASGFFVVNDAGTHVYCPALEDHMVDKEAELTKKRQGGKARADQLRADQGLQQ